MPLNILILCTGNSARSILGEALAGHLSQGRARSYSAGSRPAGQVNPAALETLEKHAIPIAAPRSKSWDEFAQHGAPVMDVVITVCDSAANEACPVWLGAPVQVHWGIPDPAHGEPLEARRAAFEAAFQTLRRRFEAFFAQPVETLTAPERRALLQAIAESVR
jgi:arsenate reductase (thioredoxin)